MILDGSASSLTWNPYYQIAIRAQEGGPLKSIVIPKKDWKWDNDTQSMSHTISFKDFTSTNEHQIELESIDDWRIKVKVCDKDGRYISTQRQRIDSKVQNGKSITVYLNEEIDVNKIKLNISGNYTLSGYSYNWIHDGIPEWLDFDTNRDPTFTSLEHNEFHIYSTYAYNLNVLTYEYGGYYDWTIISKGGEDVKFILPNLPDQLFESYNDLQERIDNPSGITNTMYQTDGDLDDITKVHRSVIPSNSNNEPDFNYSSKRTRINL